MWNKITESKLNININLKGEISFKTFSKSVFCIRRQIEKRASFKYIFTTSLYHSCKLSTQMKSKLMQSNKLEPLTTLYIYTPRFCSDSSFSLKIERRSPFNNSFNLFIQSLLLLPLKKICKSKINIATQTN